MGRGQSDLKVEAEQPDQALIVDHRSLLISHVSTCATLCSEGLSGAMQTDGWTSWKGEETEKRA